MANSIKRGSSTQPNTFNMGDWAIGLSNGKGPTGSTGFKKGVEIPAGGYAIYSDDIRARIAHNDSELIQTINKLSLANQQWYTLYAITYPESSYAPANRDGITPGYNDTTSSKLYSASRDLNYYVFDEDTNSWVPDSYFNGERIEGHCYDTYDGQPAQHATFQADFDNIKATFPNATHIVIGSHAAENNDNDAGTLQRLQMLGLPDDHIGQPRPEYILVGKIGKPQYQFYARENVNWAVATMNIQLPMEGIARTNVTDAMSWARNNGILVLNDSFNNIVTDGLKLYLDAGKIQSYPLGGNTLYDLSGNGNNHNIVNNPSHSGYDFTLNETQGFNIGNAATKSTNSTVAIWYKTTDTQELWVRGDTGSEYIAAAYPNVDYYHQGSGSPTYYADLNNIVNPNTQGVRNGEYHMWEAKNVDFTAWDSMNWFLYGSSWNMNGSVAKIAVYDRALTAEESLQNYYGAPIITRNLQQYYDFGNIICYTPGLDSVKNMANTSQKAPIVNTGNAITYSSHIGYFEWDGDNDAYIDIPDTGEMSKFTLSTWAYNTEGASNGRNSILRDYWEIVGTSIQFWSYSFDNDYWRASPNGMVPYNEWTHITTTWDGSVIRHYINGQLIWTDPNTSGGTSQSLFYMGGYGGRMLNGKFSTLSIYNDELSQNEIFQNYNSTVSRYK